MKYTARYRTDFWFIYRLIPRHIKRPECHNSKYFNKFPKPKKDEYYYDPTLDDPFLNQLASEILKKIGKKSDKYKAGYILKLVQMGYTYKHDSELFGVEDKHGYPVCTSYLHLGDCEDGAILGAGLSKLCGLDQTLIYVYGHMAYGVRVNGFGCKYEYNGKKYLWCETTDTMPIGFHQNNKKIYGIYEPSLPPKDYIDTYTYNDQFDKYPLR